MAQVTLRDVRKSYGKTEVIPPLNLEIQSGELIALVGPSGSGKSTLLRVIAGLGDINGGTITVDGTDVTENDPGERDMAMVFQSYALYPHMTVAENMSFALRMAKVDAAEIARRVAEAVRILALEGLEDRKPGQLSGGQRQRVAMGRAIVRQPAVFLFDEPLSNLDAKLRAKTRLELRQLHDRLGATSIFVTHDQIEAMTMADRIVLLDHGRIQQIGTPQDIYHRPLNRFVAGFIGSPEINMLTQPPALAGDAFAAGQLALPAGAARPKLREAIQAGRSVEIGVRPEHFSVSETPFDGAVPVDIVAVEFTGQDAFVTGGSEIGQLTIRIDLRSDPGLSDRLSKGGNLHAAVMADHWHAFDSESGDCLSNV
ncbi:sn-glycerol-3-phosphate ABC transporter ATP-binding protein UgpC [Pseudooceanicola sp. 216_PA32_1]|uniref:sn-glycerol-3-phosphate ABC transporter ATP-binding protein UgpC n=1 Tax=Pseudooceanicola pacificus TaxID=2676438 RepID=A0A844WDW8_9RHOB|nr:sn-glycerol-3-phosphate ABC transporter ATP-binding protein UgpC [Pseudooceanicola pacificus]MWB77990.1 sn-glycerol-3-phosphate ABC transporter ATP-binding protein UgpC [Pseudooceanicola pacificus]